MFGIGFAEVLVIILIFGIKLLPPYLIWKYYQELVVSFNVKYKTFAPRFWAPTVDSLVLTIISLPIVIVLQFELPDKIAISLMVINMLIFYAYSIYMHGKYGQTVGKMVCKIKVVNAEDEEEIGYIQALIRDFTPLIFGSSTFHVDLTILPRGAAIR